MTNEQRGWERAGVNYWDNPDCPRTYLESALMRLVLFVEGARVSRSTVAKLDEPSLREDVAFYERMSEK